MLLTIQILIEKVSEATHQTIIICSGEHICKNEVGLFATSRRLMTEGVFWKSAEFDTYGTMIIVMTDCQTTYC